MKIPVHIAEKLLQLSQGGIIPSGKAKHTLIDALVAERILKEVEGFKKSFPSQTKKH